jgi:hypothetical protein
MNPLLLGVLCSGPIWLVVAILGALAQHGGDKLSRWWRVNPPAPVRAYRQARVRRLEQRISQLRTDNDTETTR